jgi:hypothetical protein
MQEEESIETAGRFLMEIKIIPGDGDCLYTSVAHQLYRFPVDPANLQYYSQLLRGFVVNYLEDNLNDSVLRDNILHTCHELFGMIAGDDVLIAHYFYNLRHNSEFWGGAESLFALVNIYQMRINVYTEAGSVTTFNPREPVITREINLFYRSGSHYDSIITVRALQDSAPPNDYVHCARSNVQTFPNDIEYTQIQDNYNELPCEKRSIIVASWNINGAASNSKRSEIDTILVNQGVDILCMQEVRTTSRVIYTTNYKWIINAHNRSRSFRGTAILLKKNLYGNFKSFTSVTENICVLRITFGDKEVAIVNFHSPSEGNRDVYGEYVKLGNLLRRLPISSEFLLTGDWNAHLGYEDRIENCPHIGTILGHFRSNNNGRLLYCFVRLNNLEVLTTKLDKSSRITWKRGANESQIDHICRKLGSQLFVRHLKATFYETISDHKLVICNIEHSRRQSTQRTQTGSSRYVSVKKKWDVELLKNETCLEKYRAKLNEKLEVFSSEENINAFWTKFVKELTEAASETLYPRKRKNPLPLATKDALDNFKRAKFELSVVPGEANREKLKEARKEMNRHLEEDEINEYRNFFQELEDYHISTRLKKTFSFVKFAKRRNVRQDVYIPLHHWEEFLRNQQGPPARPIPADHHPLLPPPTEKDVKRILLGMKTGKAPGEDSLQLELLLFGTEKVVEILTKILQHVWLTNEVPETWTTSLLFPLPKVKKPNGTGDYRTIALASIGYKIYANFLYQQMESYLHVVGSYQAGFVRGRSTGDHLFVLRRFLEERWNEGRTLN